LQKTGFLLLADSTTLFIVFPIPYFCELARSKCRYLIDGGAKGTANFQKTASEYHIRIGFNRPRFTGQRLRLEHEPRRREQARCAARRLDFALGHKAGTPALGLLVRGIAVLLQAAAG